MSPVLIVGAAVTVVVAAVRSTWSPCGWSMLSTITPLTERGRGHRFGATASWFVGGAVLGGALLGGVAAVLASLVDGSGASATVRLAIGGGAALAAALLDARHLGPTLPHHRRQVNEEWLDEFRPWVYAAGFGLQIGTGLSTYIMTGAVYLVIVLAALSGAATTAALLGTAFGLLRGLAVLTGRGNIDPARLAVFHRRFADLDEPVRRAVIAVLVAVGAGLLSGAAGLPTVVGVAVPTGVLVVAAAAVGSRHYAAATSIRDNAPLSSATELARRTNEPTTA